MKKYISIISAALLIIFASTSCSKWLDVNKNVDAPDNVDELLYLPGVLSAMQGFYWDIRATGPLSQMMGTTGYTSFAGHGFSSGSDAGGEIWRTVYWLQGVNLENMIKQSIANEKWTLAGIGMAVKAYGWDKLTKEHGEVPCKQAYEPGRLMFDYDYQEDVYPIVRQWANTAIMYLQKEDTKTPSLKTADLAYGGDKEKWIKLAHSVIASNLASLSNKKDFVEKYADSLIYHAGLGLQTADDDFTVSVAGGGDDALFSAYNNFWGVSRANLGYSYFPHDYAVQVMTGTVPKYNTSGDLKKVFRTDDPSKLANTWYPFELADKQYCADTLKIAGHCDPRVICKMASRSDQSNAYININEPDSIMNWVYQGGSFTSYTGGIAGNNAVTFYGTWRTGYTVNKTRNGSGKWIYRDDAPYILMTAAENWFNLSECYFKKGNKAEALRAWKEGIKQDFAFTRKYINTGAPTTTDNGAGGSYTWPVDGKKYYYGGSLPGGCPITLEAFDKMTEDYLAGPYVEGVTQNDLTLTHIMLQKFNALFPWGALEAWTDQRKYLYDIKFTGEYPGDNNGWEQNLLYQKDDNDPTKVFKGYYLKPADVQGRRSSYSTTQNKGGSPCFRIRPRYNSEYMWNKNTLAVLAPISGYCQVYHTSIPWFAYPGDQPKEQRIGPDAF